MYANKVETKEKIKIINYNIDVEAFIQISLVLFVHYC